MKKKERRRGELICEDEGRLGKVGKTREDKMNKNETRKRREGVGVEGRSA